MQTRVQEELILNINDNQINTVNVAKNLGLFLDSKLRFHEHIARTVKKCYSALKILYTNVSIINFKIRKKMVETLVLSIINYCITVYYPCLDKITQYRLQKIQNSCCRFIFGLKKFDRVSEKINQLGWLNISNTFNLHMSVFVHRLFLTSSPSYLREKLIYRREIHNVNIRFPSTLSLPKFRSAIFTRSFTYNACTIYNTLKNEFKSCSINGFRKKVKSCLIIKQ